MNEGLQFSIIIPVFNRPQELDELLGSLARETDKGFEVIIVEDGSTVKSEEITNSYVDQLNLHYFFKENEGPGPARNFGVRAASGNYFIFFDSDCLIPEGYIETVRIALLSDYVDAFGGPDAAHESFTPIQKAISYSMTSILTTGGIRGGSEKVDRFHPRSFNMGFSKEVFERTGGFAKMRFGEDLDLSLRIIEAGFSTALIKDAFVYHKRRTDFTKFFRQVHNSGIARINLYKRHPHTLKAVHFFPAAFLVFVVFSLFCLPFGFFLPVILVGFYLLLILLDSLRVNGSLEVALLSSVAAFVQHTGYGSGFIKAFWKRIVLGQDEFHAYSRNFYK
jgi:glycosyltransferase involved in cell wall biosynthesis